jgi:hypothetical protein
MMIPLAKSNCLSIVVYIPWDLEDYATRVKKGLGTPASIARLQRKFTNPQLGRVNKPATVVDICGKIIIWYLPGLISAQQSVLLVFILCVNLIPKTY